MAEKFPFSMWNYKPLNELSLEHVDIWAECGMTVPMAPWDSSDHIDEYLRYLDKAQEKGMKLLVPMNFSGNGSYEERFKAAYEKIKHPALYGFFVADEPHGRGALASCANLIRTQKKIAPELHPYVNFMDGVSTYPEEHFGGTDFAGWLEGIKNDGGDFAISLDSYGPMINATCVDWFFQASERNITAAEKAGIRPWANMLLSGHYAYRVPSERDVAWQISIPAALGYSGIIWFRFYDRDYATEYMGSPIDEFGYKTEHYYNLLRNQRRFNTHYGELMPRLRRKKTFLIGYRDRECYSMYDENSHDLIKAIEGYEPGVASFFEDEEGGEYLVIANASMEYHQNYVLRYDESVCSVDELFFNGTRKQHLAAGEDKYLHVGQMGVFKITRK